MSNKPAKEEREGKLAGSVKESRWSRPRADTEYLTQTFGFSHECTSHRASRLEVHLRLGLKDGQAIRSE